MRDGAPPGRPARALHGWRVRGDGCGRGALRRRADRGTGGGQPGAQRARAPADDRRRRVILQRWRARGRSDAGRRTSCKDLVTEHQRNAMLFFISTRRLTMRKTCFLALLLFSLSSVAEATTTTYSGEAVVRSIAPTRVAVFFDTNGDHLIDNGFLLTTDV